MKPHPLWPARVSALGLQVTVREQGVETGGGGGGGLKTVEIWVECSSMATVCGVHHAVLGRVQVSANSYVHTRALTLVCSHLCVHTHAHTFVRTPSEVHTLAYVSEEQSSFLRHEYVTNMLARYVMFARL